MAQSDTDKQAAIDQFMARGKPKPQGRTNVAIEVHGYLVEEGLVVGADIKTGEIVKAKLAPYTPPEPKPGERRKPAAKRPEIADFADPKNKVSTPANGIILLEGAYTRNGITTANWATSMVKSPEDGMLLTGMVQPLQPQEVQPNLFVQRVRVLSDQQSTLVNSEGDLKKALVAALAGQNPGSPLAMVRAEGRDLKGEAVVRSMVVYSKFETIEGEGGKKESVPLPPEKSVDSFLSTEDGKLLQYIVGSVRMEVVPGTILQVGRDTLIGRMERSRSFDRFFTPKPTEDRQNPFPKWAPGFVSVVFKDDKAIVTQVSREQPNGPLFDLKDMPTAHSALNAVPTLPDPDDDVDFPMDGPDDSLFERRPPQNTASDGPTATGPRMRR